jgi:hypothetical protein
MNFTKEQIQQTCATFGSLLKLPVGIDGAKLMWAISGAESSFGANCTPRHEPAYDVNGYYARTSKDVQGLLAVYGSQAAYSYGPWQIMLVNAPGFSPEQMTMDLTTNAQAFVGYVNRFVLGYRKAATVEQIAQTYNSGRFGVNVSPGVLAYGQKVADYYSSVTAL